MITVPNWSISGGAHIWLPAFDLTALNFETEAVREWDASWGFGNQIS